MMDYYKKFIRDEYEWVYGECTDSTEQLLEEFNIDITPEEFEDNFGLFMDVATSNLLNNDDVVQYIHDGMHDDLTYVLTKYVEDKEKFIEKYKPNDAVIRDELEEEIISAYRTLTLYNISEDVLIKHDYIDKEKTELLNEVGKLMDNVKELESINVSFNYTDGTEYEYKFTKNKERESTAPSWLRDIIK